MIGIEEHLVKALDMCVQNSGNLMDFVEHRADA
jgi:hypothetical protein